MQLVFRDFIYHFEQIHAIVGLKAIGNMLHQQNIERHKVTDQTNR